MIVRLTLRHLLPRECQCRTRQRTTTAGRRTGPPPQQYPVQPYPPQGYPPPYAQQPPPHPYPVAVPYPVHQRGVVVVQTGIGGWHVLHLIMTCMTCGLWAPVWIIHAIVGGRQTTAHY